MTFDTRTKLQNQRSKHTGPGPVNCTANCQSSLSGTVLSTEVGMNSDCPQWDRAGTLSTEIGMSSDCPQWDSAGTLSTEIRINSTMYSEITSMVRN